VAKKRDISSFIEDDNLDIKIEKGNKFDVDERPEVKPREKEKLKPYAKIFNDSLKGESKEKIQTVLFMKNNDRIEILQSVVPGLNKADAVNYIIDYYFRKYGSDILNDYREKQNDIKDLF